MGGMNLSFAGCGFLGIYHVGVAVCFKKYAPHLLLEKIGGASAGALAACCLLCDLPLGHMTSDFFRVVREARKHSLGPFSPSFSIQHCLLEGLQKHLPSDAHKRVSGRLHISLTRVYDGKNVIVSEFNSREDLLQALLCACFIPGFSGILPPKFHGVRYMDGGFSDNLPILDENTVTVSPFCGESDICPRDQSSQLFHLNWANTSIEISRQNISRFVRILFPPKPELLSNLCQQGFDDALQFLHRNNLISCRRCVAVQSTFVVSETISESQDYDPECKECKKHRKDALLGNMPETVLEVIQDCIDSANKGLANWLFRHRGIKLLSLPATVPADFLLATISKLLKLAATATEQIQNIIMLIVEELQQLVKVKLAQKSKLNVIGNSQNESYGNLESSKRYGGSKVSILIDENGLHLKDNDGDNDTFDHILKMTTHHDAIYAYYYTDESNKVKVTEIFDMTESNTLPPELNNILDNSTLDNLHIENEWNGIESDLLLGISSGNIYSSTLIETTTNDSNNNNNNVRNLVYDMDDFKNYSGIEIEEISSDPEVDHHESEQMKQIQQQQQQQLNNKSQTAIINIEEDKQEKENNKIVENCKTIPNNEKRQKFETIV